MCIAGFELQISVVLEVATQQQSLQIHFVWQNPSKVLKSLYIRPVNNFSLNKWFLTQDPYRDLAFTALCTIYNVPSPTCIVHQRPKFKSFYVPYSSPLLQRKEHMQVRTKREAGNVKLINLCRASKQCYQMARLFIQYSAIYNNDSRVTRWLDYLFNFRLFTTMIAKIVPKLG